MGYFQRLQLERNYQDARATFDKAVQKLRERIGVSPKDEFMQLSATIKTAWRIVELRGTILNVISMSTVG